MPQSESDEWRPQVICVYDIMYRGTPFWLCGVKEPAGVQIFPYTFRIYSGLEVTERG